MRGLPARIWYFFIGRFVEYLFMLSPIVHSNDVLLLVG